MIFTNPEIIEGINRLTFLWKELDLKVRADRTTDAGFAELSFYNVNGTGESIIHTCKTNLLSSGSMTQLAKRLSQHSAEAPWTQIMTCLTVKTIQYVRQGEPGIMLEPSGDISHPGYYIEPIIIKGAPSVIYGDKGVNKTTLGLALLGLISLGVVPSENPTDDNPLGFGPAAKANVAILDWESTQELTKYTLATLVTGGTIPWYILPYLRCKQPLADDIDRIGNFLKDNDIKVVLIDSLGQAAGSDRYDSSGKTVALRFFEALRLLNVTPLIIAQNAKGADNKKTIFGSTYFTYYSRNIFELRSKENDINTNEKHIALFHTEANYSAKYSPIGFNLYYTDDALLIKREEVSLSQFLERVSQMKEMYELMRKGPQTRNTIADALGITVGQADTLLNRGHTRGELITIKRGLHGLKLKEGDMFDEGYS